MGLWREGSTARGGARDGGASTLWGRSFFPAATVVATSEYVFSNSRSLFFAESSRAILRRLEGKRLLSDWVRAAHRRFAKLRAANCGGVTPSGSRSRPAANGGRSLAILEDFTPLFPHLS